MKHIYWLEEVGKEHNDIVGKKCANLGELMRGGFRVPQGFALSLAAYDKFMKETGALDEIRRYLATFHADPDNPADMAKFEEASKAIREIVNSKRMPEDLEQEVRYCYRELCRRVGIENVPVATRSAGPVSHPGQYETYLYIKGEEEVLKNIIKVWSSTFNQRSLVARARLKLPLEYDPIGVAVITMVNAKAAGVMFTLNPLNGDRSKIVINASWGVGESVVSGEVTPDVWIIDKITMEVVQKTIAPKLIERVIDTEKGELIVRDTPPERVEASCLNEEEALELARIGKLIEQHYGVPQDIEWAIDRDLSFPQNVFMLQARPETVWSQRKAERVTSASSGLDYVTAIMKTGIRR